MSESEGVSGGSGGGEVGPAAATRGSAGRGRLPRNVTVMGLASLVNDVASEMVYPLLPNFLLGTLGASRTQLGVIEGVADSLSSLLKLVSGSWSDRVGNRKRFVVVGYSMAALARPFLGLARFPWHIFALRGFDRVGKGLRTAPRDALIAESTSVGERGRAFGFHRAMDHLGAAIGPLLAMLFLFFRPNDYRTLFVLTIVPGVLVVLIVTLGLREPARREPPKERLRLSLAPFGGDFRLLLLALVVFSLGNASDAFLLVRAGELGISAVWLPLLWSLFHVAKSLGNLLAGRAVDLLGARPLLGAGWFVYALIYLLFAWANQAWQIWPLFLGYAVFYALTEPAEKTLIADLVGNDRKGLAFGWFNTAMGISALPASVIFGWLYDQFGPFAAFGWGAGLALVAALMLLGIRPAAGEGVSAGEAAPAPVGG